MRMRLSLRALVLLPFFGLSLPCFAGFASTETFLPAVGRVTGQGGAQFYTTVWATNLTGAPVSFTFDFLKQGQDNSSPISFTDNLAAGETKVYENIIENKFSLTGAIGAARVISTGEILVAERIYDQPPGADVGNTEGLFFAGVPKSFSISSGQSASIQGINQGGAENFRYNFALVETGGGSPTVNVQLFDGSGTLLGQKAYVLQPYEQIQPNVADIAAAVHTTNARITATVTGGSGSALLAGAQLANVSQDSSGFEMSFRDQLLGGGAAGVSSLNALTGAVSLIAGTNVTLTTVGNGIKIDVAAGGGGSGLVLPYSNTASNPTGTVFGILNTGGIPPGGSFNSAISGFAGGIGLLGVQGNSAPDVTNFPSGVVGASGDQAGVTGLSTNNNGVQGFSGSSSTNIAGVVGYDSVGANTGYLGTPEYGVKGTSPQGNAIFGLTNAGGGAGVQGQNGPNKTNGYLGGFDWGVAGIVPNSSQSGVLGIAVGNAGYPVGSAGVQGITTTGQAGVIGVRGAPSALAIPAGVVGVSDGVDGVVGVSNSSVGTFGRSTTFHGVWGETGAGGFNAGVYGITSSSGIGVYGKSANSSAYAIYGDAGSQGFAGVFNGAVNVNGDFAVTGGHNKSFVDPHPTDPSREIRYICLEGGEAGTYFRGSGKIVNGFAVLDVPEDFRNVSSDKSITVHLTPVGAPAVLFCAKKGLDKIVIQANSDVDFDYIVHGIRKGSEDFRAVEANALYVPRFAGDSNFAAQMSERTLVSLKANGILNPDGSINLATAHRLGWDQRESWTAAEQETTRR